MEEWPLWSSSDCIEHLSTCSGCKICEELLEFYMACDMCGSWGSKESNGWNMIDNKFYCDYCYSKIRVNEKW